MFHPQVIAYRLKALERKFVKRFTLQHHTVQEVSDFNGRMREIQDDEGNLKRTLEEDEQSFIISEQVICKVDFAYFAERHIWINREGQGLARMFPLLESQQFVLQRIGDIELAIVEGRHADGILINLLKGARQIGGSTLAEAIGVHRFTSQTNIFGLIAADVPDQSGFLFDMYERGVDNLPFYLRSDITDRVKATEMKFNTGSHIWVGSGKSVRGTEGKRGQLGRGRTLSFVHLSELSTWDTPGQIDDALLHAIPRSSRTFVMFESTAKGRHNWWHDHWNICKQGLGRFKNIFIPWYVERKKYSLPAPEDWSPSITTLAHARRCEETAPRWIEREVQLNRDQLYWYEQTRAYYEAKDELKSFVEEVGAVDDEETFQHSGKSIFPTATLQRVRDQARGMLGVAEVKSHMELR